MRPRAAQLARELTALRDAEGVIHVGAAVDWARNNPDSELHSELNWDDASAAEAHRRWQVRRLIAIFVEPTTGSRSYVSLSVDRAKDGGGYRPVEGVLGNRDLRAIMLQDALADVQRLQQKYQALQELAEIWDAAERVRRRKQPGDEPG